MAFHWNKLESPSTKDALCQVRLKLATRLWRRRFLNFVNMLSLFRYYLPLEKGMDLHWTNLNPHHPRILCAKFDWNWPRKSGEEDDFVKRLQTDWRTTENRRSKKLTWAFSSGELKTKNDPTEQKKQKQTNKQTNKQKQNKAKNECVNFALQCAGSNHFLWLHYKL